MLGDLDLLQVSPRLCCAPLQCALGKALTTSSCLPQQQVPFGGSQWQLEEIIVLWIFDFNNSPGIQAASDFFPLHLNKLIGSNNSEGNASLVETEKKQVTVLIFS